MISFLECINDKYIAIVEGKKPTAVSISVIDDKYISEKVKTQKWGSKTIEKLAGFMKENYPTLKGFNKTSSE